MYYAFTGGAGCTAARTLSSGTTYSSLPSPSGLGDDSCHRQCYDVLQERHILTEVITLKHAWVSSPQHTPPEKGPIGKGCNSGVPMISDAGMYEVSRSIDDSLFSIGDTKLPASRGWTRSQGHKHMGHSLCGVHSAHDAGSLTGHPPISNYEYSCIRLDRCMLRMNCQENISPAETPCPRATCLQLLAPA